MVDKMDSEGDPRKEKSENRRLFIGRTVIYGGPGWT